MLEMNPEIRAQWCAALRSGEYAQGQQALREGDTYCCLGVLCDLAVKAGVLGEPATPQTGYGADKGLWFYGGRCDYLPDAVMEWTGLGFTPRITGGDYLANLNDEGMSFAEIADLIDGGTS